MYTGEMVKNCCVFGCKKYIEKKEGLRFFRFPLADKGRCAKWTAAVRREAWQPTQICNEHFITGRLTRIDQLLSGFKRYTLEIVVGLKTFPLHELLLSIYSQTLDKIAEYVSIFQ